MPPDSSRAEPEDAALARFLAEELGHVAGDAPPPDGWHFTAPLWRWTGGETATSWFFVTVTEALAADIRAASRARAGAWGMVKVMARVGDTRWSTSLFYSKDVGSFLLPMKASVRKAEKLVEGDAVAVQLTLA